MSNHSFKPHLGNIDKQKQDVRPVQLKTINSQLILLLIMATCATGIMFWITNYAIGVSPDSTLYLEAAENFLVGKGFYANNNPLTIAPPAYPFSIAVISYIYQGDVLLGARFLHALLFGINTLLLGIIVMLMVPNSWSAMGYILLGFLSSPIIVLSHAMAWSDLLFLATCLLTFIILTWYIRTTSRLSLLALSLIVGLATLVRYVGVTLLPPIIVIILLYQQSHTKQKAKNIMLLSIIALLPLFVWMVRSIIVGQSVGGREYSFQFLGFHLEIPLMFAQFYAFVVPINWSIRAESVQFTIAMIIITGIAIVLYQKRYFHKNFYSISVMLFFAFACFFVSYLLFLILSQLFLEVRNTWDARILIPAFISLVLIVVHLIWALASETTYKKGIRLSFSFVAMISISLNATVTVPKADQIHTDGYYYTSRMWRESDIMTIISSLGTEQLIYSNRPELIRFLTSNDSLMIPHHSIVGTRFPNQNYIEELSSMCREIELGVAQLVYLEQFPHRWYLPTIEDIQSTCNLPIFYSSEHGIILSNLPQSNID